MATPASSPLLLVLCFCLATMQTILALSSSPPPPPFRLQNLDHVVLKCRNFDKMFSFYTDILGCTVDHPDDVGRFGGALTHLRAGTNTMIDLLSLDTSQLTPEGQEKVLELLRRKTFPEQIIDASSSSPLDHFCLRIDPFDESHLVDYFENQHKIPILSSGLRQGAQGVGPSVYIEDPEGNVIELKGPSIKHPTKLEEEAQAPRREEERKNTDVKVKIGESSGDDITNTKTIDEQTKDPRSTVTAANIPSTPCTRICRYNAGFYDGQVCIGCFREAYEIGTWSSMTDTEKSFALLDSADRTPLEENNINNFEGSIARDELLRQAQYWQDRSSK